jgi:hypothetical protein
LKSQSIAHPLLQNHMPSLRLKPSPRVRKALLGIATVAMVAYASFATLVVWAMRQPPETFGKVMAKMPGPVPFLLFPFETAWLRLRAGSLRPGDVAPEFSLMKLDHSGRVQLSALTAKQPVVLIFGSYT